LNHSLYLILAGRNKLKLKAISKEYLPQKALDNWRMPNGVIIAHTQVFVLLKLCYDVLGTANQKIKSHLLYTDGVLGSATHTMQYLKENVLTTFIFIPN
jgi:hypothetical protein